MDSMLLAFFEQTSLGTRLLQARRRWERGLIVVCVLIFLVPLAIVGPQFWFGLQTGVWSAYLFQVAPALQGLAAPLIGARIVRSWCYEDAYRASVPKLRETAAAEMVSHQHPDLDRERAPDAAAHMEGTTQVLRLGNPVPTQSATLAFYGVLALLGGAVCLAAAVGIPLAEGNGQLDLAFLPVWQDALLVLGVGVGLFLVGASVGSARWLRRLHRAGWLEVDQLGVRLLGSSPGSRDDLAWSEVRAFSQTGNRTYCLDTGQRLLIWRAPLWGGATAAHTQLVTIIAAHTGLSPYPLAPQVQATYWSVKRLPWSAGLRALVITPIVALVVVLSGLWPVPQVQAWQFQPLAARTHAEKPLYSDPLTTDDGNWTPPFPSGAGPQGMAVSYSSAGITLAAEPNGFEPYVQSSQAYQDAAVEITFRSLGTMGEYDGVGLLVRGEYGDPDAVGITFNQQGEWSASVGDILTDPYGVINQHDSAIRTGSGTWNTLLVVMRGPQYLIFANGQYVGAYYHTPVQSGPIILQVASLSESGAQFRNLTVYPAVYS